MTSHLSSETAGRWVAGLTEPDESAAIEQHLSECSACEALFQREAAAEVVLSQAAFGLRPRAAVVPFKRTSTRWVGFSIGATVALAASLMFLFRPPKCDGSRSPKTTPSASMATTAVREELPSLSVPRYDQGLDVSAVGLEADAPFPL